MTSDMPWIHLQGIGKFRAKKASEFRVGEKIVYNYGESSKVISMSPKGKSILFETESGGKRYKRRKSRETLMGWMP